MGVTQSKKFVAYLLAELSWKAILAGYLFWRDSSVIALTIIIVVGFLEVAYILGQAALDRYLMLIDQTVGDIHPRKKEPEKNA